MDIPGSDEIQAKIKAALYAGKKIEAIKLCREVTGLGLKEAKELIDAVDAELRQKEPQRFTHAEGSSGCGMIVVLLVIALIAAAAIVL